MDNLPTYDILDHTKDQGYIILVLWKTIDQLPYIDNLNSYGLVVSRAFDAILDHKAIIDAYKDQALWIAIQDSKDPFLYPIVYAKNPILEGKLLFLANPTH
jgi:hypothetical protein